VPPQAQNLDKVKKGDRFRVRYVEAVADDEPLERLAVGDRVAIRRAAF